MTYKISMKFYSKQSECAKHSALFRFCKSDENDFDQFGNKYQLDFNISILWHDARRAFNHQRNFFTCFL